MISAYNKLQGNVNLNDLFLYDEYQVQNYIVRTRAISIKELKGFAKGLHSDLDAAKNALIMHWSNGQVEGQINKLKAIKRLIYERASFDLLR